MTSFTERFRQAFDRAVEKGWITSQPDLAEKVKISQANISRWYNGERGDRVDFNVVLDLADDSRTNASPNNRARLLTCGDGVGCQNRI